MDVLTKQIRNVSIAGHGQTGKTTLLEQLLFSGGVITKAEAVASGKTVSDNSPEEIERKISIYASLAHITWKDNNINIWDTPGSSDFVGEVISAFRSCELAIMLIDGRSGAQIETIKLWRDLNARKKPRAVFINRCDDDRSDFENAYKDIHTKFNANLCPITIPMGKGSNFKGVIDVLNGKAYLVPENGQIEKPIDIPEEFKGAYENALEELASAASESDEALMDKFLEEGILSHDEIIQGLKKALAENLAVPVFAGSPIKNSGMIPLLDFIIDIGPCPLDSFETTGKVGEELTPVPFQPDEALKAVVVKTASDQFSGRMSYIKVVSGTLKSESEIWNVSEDRKEKIGKLYRCTGKKLEEIKSIATGDIGIAVKLAGTRTSDTLSVNQDTVPFTRLRHPNPVFSRAVSAKEKKDEDKMSEMLAKASDEDRTLRYKYNPETKQNVVSGMGELHINIILERIKSQAKINVETAVPRVAYRETIQKKNQAEYTHKKQSGGHGQFGRVVLALEPLERGEKYKFTNSIFGGAVSKGYIPGIEKGIKEAMEHGVLAGYPVVDVGVTLLDGKEHPVDSSEMAFKIAARNAFREASKVSTPILLEPIMNITVWVESKYLGDIMSDMSGKRGRILGQSPLGGGIEEIRAQVPQAELLKYAIDLRSMTSGTGSFETSFDHYDPISGKIAEDVIAAAKEFMTVRIEDD